MSDKTIVVQLDSSELATVLAALRFWQKANGDARGGAVVIEREEYEAIADIACEHGDALTASAIDTLCERINCSPAQEDPVIVVEGGMVQSVFVPVSDKACPVVY